MARLILYPASATARTVQLDKSSMLIGSGRDADILLEDASVKDCHARIESRPDGYYLISLVHPPGVFVNGAEVTFHRLASGDTVAIGDVEAVFSLPGDDTSNGEAAIVGEMDEPAGRPAGPTALTISPQRVVICPRCGQHLEPGAQRCAYCGVHVSNLPAMPMNYIPPTPVSQSGAGIIPVIALLGALTVIGAPVALVMGLMSLVIIRRRGGTVRDHRMAQWSIGLGLLWIMLGLLAVGGTVWKAHRREQLNVAEVNETKVIRALKNLACAQKYIHTIEFCDTDGDGNSEYGELADLAETRSPFFDADLADGEAYGYRFAMREASEGRFLAVAQPLLHNSTGRRTFAIDATGQIRGGESEGETFGQIATVLPVLQGERNAYYRIDDEIAKDVINYVQSLSSSPEDQEKRRRILTRVRREFTLTSAGRELEGIEDSVDRAVTENRAQVLYWEAEQALEEGDQDLALAKLQEIATEYSSYSKIAPVERELAELRSTISHQREKEAGELFAEAERLERQGASTLEVQQLYQRIEKIYPDTEVAERIATLKPELKRQLREQNAKAIFSNLMELSPEQDYERILSQANQFRRNYNDTDLYAKIQNELNEKERSARANSWRYRTEQSIEDGRMRGALAELEAAIRENPDLQYDLRDLCANLYRNAAEKLMEEGDDRGALTYYSRLNHVLTISESGEQVEPDLLAKLHNEVGQADYESRRFAAARWHLDNAAWHYPDDAQFHLRLGVSRMYSGLYRAADTALSHSLSLQPHMDQALLYRAYLNLRTVRAYNRAIAKALDLQISARENLFGTTGNNPEGDAKTSDSTVTDEEILFDTDRVQPAGDVSALGKVFAAGSDDIPEPTDLELIFHFNPDTSRTLLADLLKMLEKLEETAELSAGDSRHKPRLDRLIMITDFRNELSKLRVLHDENVAALKTMNSMITEMQAKVVSAGRDIQGVGSRQPRIAPLSERLLPECKAKARHLAAISKLLDSNMRRETELRELIFNMADGALRDLATSGTANLNISYNTQAQLSNPDNIADIGQVVLSLRDLTQEELDLEDLLGAAEGNVRVPSAGK